MSVFGATLSPVLYYTAPALADGTNYANITFAAIDQVGASSSPFTIEIDIAPNTPPVATSATLAATQEAMSAPITLSGTDVDVADAGSLQIHITRLPLHGSLFISSNNVTSVPALVTGPITYYTDQRGSDGFIFKVTDQLGLSSPIMLVPISITPVNHPPVVSFAGTVTVLETSNATITLISASDPDGDAVTIYISALPLLGTLYQTSGAPITSVNTSITDSLYRLVYVPDPNLSDQVTSFSFFGNDGVGWANSITSEISVSVSITHVNRPPIAHPGAVGKTFNPGNFATVPNVTDLDTPAAQLSIVIQSLPDPTMGTLTDQQGTAISAGQVIPYPFALEFAPISTAVGGTDFRFYAKDNTDVSPTVAFGIFINSGINSAPVASAAHSYTAVHGEPLSIALGVHDDDFYELFTFEVSAQLSGSGLLTDATSLVTFTPPKFNITVLQVRV